MSIVQKTGIVYAPVASAAPFWLCRAPKQAHEAPSALSRWRSLPRCFFAAILLLASPGVTAVALAGTTIIHVDTEEGGDLYTGTRAEWTTLPQNAKGALFWNGSKWVSNDTAAHMYFTDLRTGQRLMEYLVTVVDSSTTLLAQLPGIPAGYTVTKRIYAYTQPAAAGGGGFAYQAVEYEISQPAGTRVLLRSRGTGNGTAGAHFDAYVEDGIGNTTAMLGDPVWLEFAGMSAVQAATQTPDINASNVRGSLPTCTPADRARYFMDINGGSDMGGVTYHFKTACFAPSIVHTAGLGSSFISSFSIMYMDGSNQLQEIRFTPALASESWQPSARLYPGVASSAGSGGTRWRSEAVLVNPGSMAQTATLELIPRDVAAVAKSAARSVPAGQLLRIPDLYADLGATSGAGMLSVTGEPLTWVRTFNQGSPGTFGQDVPPASLADGFAAATDVLFPITTPANQATEYRSNLLLVNLESAPITFTLTAGSKTATKTVPGGTYTQIDKVGTFLQLPAGLVVLAVRATGRWAGTVSTVDPGSGDPTTVRGLLPTTQDLVLFPGVASVAGSLSTQWRSEAVLYNAGMAVKTVLLEILPKDGSTVAASTSLQLQPKEVRRLADLYAELHAAGGSGLLRVTGDVLSWVRTYNQGTGATFGQDVPPVLPAGGTEAGSEVLYPVSKPGDKAKEFRSNLILYNHGTAKLTCTVASGSKSKTTDVPAGAYAQVNDVGTWLGVPAGWTTITVKANGRWSGTVSTIDPYTGDPTTVVGLAR